MFSPYVFGLLPVPLSGAFDGGRLNLADDFDAHVAWFRQASNQDGYYYPPTACRVDVDLDTNEPRREIERTRRPARLYPLPASHTLYFDAPVDARLSERSDAALVIQLLAYLYGTRLQFADWQHEGRIPFRSRHNISLRPATALHFLGHAYRWWQNQSPDIRTRLINVLYVHTRAQSLDWEWDAFVYEYMVFDALYKLHCDLVGSKGKDPHGERFRVMMDHYGLASNDDLVKVLYKTRNELAHEALWTGAFLGFGSDITNAHQLPRHLGRLNKRLICGLLGYRNGYQHKPWYVLGTFSFDLPANI